MDDNSRRSVLENAAYDAPNLNDWQREVILDAAIYGKSGVIKGPTGIGKTVLMGTMAKVLDSKTIILVPRINLAEQTRDEFTGSLVGIPKDKIGIYNVEVSNKEKQEALDKQVLITTPASYMSLIRRELIDPSKVEYVCLDEAHRMSGERAKLVLKELIDQPEILVHAFTATDEFADGRIVGKELFNTSDYIHSITFKEAVERGKLPTTINVIRRTEISAADIPSGKKLTAAEQRRLVSRIGRDEVAIEMLQNYIEPRSNTKLSEKLSIWYCAGIEHAKAVTQKINDAIGASKKTPYAVFVSGETPKKKLAKIIEKHRKGKIKALINADLLIEGYNNNKARVCYMLRDTDSPIIAVQPPGRVTRLDPDNPDEVSIIINLIDDDRPSKVFADYAGGILIASEEGLKKLSRVFDGGGKTEGALDKDKDFDMDVLPPILNEEYYAIWTRWRDSKLSDQKTPRWLSKEEFARYLGFSENDQEFNNAWEVVESKGTIAGETVEYGNKFLGLEKLFCVSVKEAPKFRKLFGLRAVVAEPEPKTEEWLSKTEVIKYFGISQRNFFFREIWNDLNRYGALSKGSDSIKFEEKATEAKRVLCLHRSELEKVRQALEEVEYKFKGENYLSRTQLYRAIGVAQKNQKFLQLWKQVESTGKIGDTKIDCGMHQDIIIRHGKEFKGKIFFVVSSNAKQAFCKELKIPLPEDVGEKTHEWLGRTKCARLIGLDIANPQLCNLWKLLEEKHQENPEYYGYKKKENTKPHFCVHISYIPEMKKILGISEEKLPPKPDGYLKKGDFAVRLGVCRQNQKFSELWEGLKINPCIGNSKIDCGNYSVRGDQSFFVHENAIGMFRTELKLEIKPKRSDIKNIAEGNYTKYPLIEFLQTSSISKVFCELWADVIESRRDDIKWEWRKSGKHIVKCIASQEDADKFKAVFDELNAKGKWARQIERENAEKQGVNSLAG